MHLHLFPENDIIPYSSMVYMVSEFKVSIPVTKHYDQGNLPKKAFNLAYGLSGLKSILTEQEPSESSHLNHLQP